MTSDSEAPQVLLCRGPFKYLENKQGDACFDFRMDNSQTVRVTRVRVFGSKAQHQGSGPNNSLVDGDSPAEPILCEDSGLQCSQTNKL